MNVLGTLRGLWHWHVRVTLCCAGLAGCEAHPGEVDASWLRIDWNLTTIENLTTIDLRCRVRGLWPIAVARHLPGRRARVAVARWALARSWVEVRTGRGTLLARFAPDWTVTDDGHVEVRWPMSTGHPLTG